MRKNIITLVFFFVFTGLAYADLETFLNNLNQQAAMDRNGYNSKLSSQFGLPLSRVDSLVSSVDSPAHAFMLLQLGVMTGKPLDSIFRTYKENQGKGWGVIAQRLGIKPGSPEFHALKQGNFVLSGKREKNRYREQHRNTKDTYWYGDKEKHGKMGKGNDK
ncbi:MAG: hypothetical protein N3A64_04795 [Desulfobacterota bacterium]|nr:hypothetical protein [Thermodesulfobacteriota bacterium]